MAAFPQLKTGAVAQYPAKRVLRFQNQTAAVPGRHRAALSRFGRPLHPWEIRLDHAGRRRNGGTRGLLRGEPGSASAASRLPTRGTAQVYPDCSLRRRSWFDRLAEMRGQNVPDGQGEPEHEHVGVSTTEQFPIRKQAQCRGP